MADTITISFLFTAVVIYTYLAATKNSKRRRMRRWARQQELIDAKRKAQNVVIESVVGKKAQFELHESI